MRMKITAMMIKVQMIRCIRVYNFPSIIITMFPFNIQLLPKHFMNSFTAAKDKVVVDVDLKTESHLRIFCKFIFSHFSPDFAIFFTS